MKPCACARRAAVSISSCVASGLRVGDVLGHRSGEQEAVVGDEGDLRAQRRDVHGRAGRRRRSSTDPRVGSYSRASSATRLVFPDPDGPTSATVRPALDLQLDVLERGRAAVVGERDVAQLDRARDRREAGARPVGSRSAARDRGSRTRRLPEATARCAIPSDDAEHAHRAGEHDQVGVERGEVTERQPAVDHLAAADQEHDREAEAGKEAEQRRVERLQARRVDVLVEHPQHRAAEAPEHVLLASERLDDPDRRRSHSSTSAVSSASRC